MSIFVSLLILSITYYLLSTFAPMLYTLCTDAVGNRTLCDMCQSKTYRKQMRHKEHRIAEHAEAAEHLDGTTDQSKMKIYRCPKLPYCLRLFLFFLSLSLSLSLPLSLSLYIFFYLSVIYSLCFNYLDSISITDNRNVFLAHARKKLVIGYLIYIGFLINYFINRI